MVEKNQKLTNQLAKVDLAIFQTVFNSGLYQEAINSLNKLISEKSEIEPKLLSEFYLKLSQWHYESQEFQKINLGEEDFKVIIQRCENATNIDAKNQEAWHYYSLMNYEACIYFSKRLNEEFSHNENANPNAHQANIFDDFSP